MAGISDTPDGTPAGPDDINSRLAEIAAELASEARFKEPSAAERARARVTAAGAEAKRVRRRFGRRRARRKDEELRRPAGSAGAPAPVRQSRRARRERWPAPDRGYADATMPSVLRSVITVIIIVALLVGVSIGLRYLFRHFGTPAAPRQTARFTPTIRSSSPPPFDASAPFANSGAALDMNGPAGITPGASVRTGTFTASQVGAAYATVRNLLVAANLNRAVLRGDRPTAFGNLLTTAQRSALYQSLGAAQAAQPASTVAGWDWLTVFAPGTGLVGNEIKVSGDQMTAAATRYGGRSVLQIQANDIFVYPVQRGTDQSSRVRVAVHVFATVLFARSGDPHGGLEPWVYAIKKYDFNVQCGTNDGLLHPLFADVGPGVAEPAGPLVNPLILTRPPQASCYRITTTI